MLKVGLTGGIGSGKTTVARIFILLGIPVYSADHRGRELMTHDPAIRARVTALLGRDAYLEDGSLNRKEIAAKVFRDDTLLASLNAVVHPAIRRDFEIWNSQFRDTPYVVQEAAILIESGGAAQMDQTILVWAPEDVRIARVMTRDEVSEADVRARMLHQIDDPVKVAAAHFIVINDGRHPLLRQVLEVHQALLWLGEHGRESDKSLDA
jgi:dephospho-CoA kinase